MKLNEEEEAMQAGRVGRVAQIAIEHQIKVGDFFGAPDFVPVSQAHVMADTESLGESGVALAGTRWRHFPPATAARASGSRPSPTRAALDFDSYKRC